MADQIEIASLGKLIKFKERTGYLDDLKKDLMERVGTAQSIILMGRTPQGEIRKRLMNPSNPKGSNNPEFSYLEHAYVEELLNLAFAFNWDVVVEETTWNGDDVMLKGYIEVRFKNNVVVRKTGFGGAKFIANNRNMSRGDAAKSAYSDMIKNAATKLGIGLDLYRHEERMIEAVVMKPTQQVVAKNIVTNDEMKAIGKILEQILNAKDTEELEKIGKGIKTLVDDKKITASQKKILQESWTSKYQKLQPKVKTVVTEETKQKVTQEEKK
jgi:hypothetical protein